MAAAALAAAALAAAEWAAAELAAAELAPARAKECVDSAAACQAVAGRARLVPPSEPG